MYYSVYIYIYIHIYIYIYLGEALRHGRPDPGHHPAVRLAPVLVPGAAPHAEDPVVALEDRPVQRVEHAAHVPPPRAEHSLPPGAADVALQRPGHRLEALEPAGIITILILTIAIIIIIIIIIVIIIISIIIIIIIITINYYYHYYHDYYY